jgi:hypothetical protein
MGQYAACTNIPRDFQPIDQIIPCSYKQGNYCGLVLVSAPHPPHQVSLLALCCLETNCQGKFDVLVKLCNPRRICAMLCCVVLCCV